MRWTHQYKKAEYIDYRKTKRFFVFPHRIGYTWIWLERATVRQKLLEYHRYILGKRLTFHSWKNTSITDA